MADAKRFSALGKAFHSMREPQADFFSFAICFISTAVTQRSLCPHHPRL
ncbi:CobN component of cobalt chelatase [Cutibacterium acnes JCM 18916]|nr:CobN component of cobalt chelatase [Cutibacterium acnes JCM 18916]